MLEQNTNNNIKQGDTVIKYIQLLSELIYVVDQIMKTKFSKTNLQKLKVKLYSDKARFSL